MSQETFEWLNNNVLIGFTEQRGNAWHYKAGSQGDEPNHYLGAIPVDDVLRRLFYWHAVEREMYTNVGGRFLVAPGVKGIARDDTNAIMGIFRSGYQGHQYDKWLLEYVASILGAELHISASGMLSGGAKAWVEVSMAETLTTPEGVSYRPNLLAATSFDGSIATVYGQTNTCTVCDNTLSAALAEKGSKFKVRHSSRSFSRFNDVRDALGLVIANGNAFAEKVSALCATHISEAQWQQMLDAMAPVDKEAKGRGATMASNKRQALSDLWATDERVTPWKNTAWGVVQAFNTFDTHIASIRGTNRVERNMLAEVMGRRDDADSQVLKTLELVLA